MLIPKLHILRLKFIFPILRDLKSSGAVYTGTIIQHWKANIS